MKRSALVLLVTFALLLTACASATAPGSTGVITAVNGNQITVAAPNGGAATTYTLGNKTLIFSSEGLPAQRSFLSEGQRVMVWANGDVAVRINVSA
jgi:hypothetical protein